MKKGNKDASCQVNLIDENETYASPDSIDEFRIDSASNDAVVIRKQ